MVQQLPFTLLIVALGGAAGAVARFLLSNFFNRVLVLHATVHIGTLLVNVLGSFAMGMLYVYIVEKAVLHPHWRSLLMVGLLGAFTTFSSFSLEAINFFEQGHPGLAAAYVVASVVLCISAAWAAIFITRVLL